MRPLSKVLVNGVRVDPTSWQTDRTISGSGVPGQARTRVGALAGTAGFDVVSDTGSPFEVASQTVGETVTIDASIDGGMFPLARVFTGLTDSVSGSALSPTLGVEAMDKINRDTALTLATRSELKGADAAFVIGLAARAMGYRSWPDGADHTVTLHGDTAGITGAVSWVDTVDGIGLDLSSAATQIVSTGTPTFEVGGLHTITVSLTDLQPALEDPATISYHGASSSLAFNRLEWEFQTGSASLDALDYRVMWETQFQRTSETVVRSRSRLVDRSTSVVSGWSSWTTATFAEENIATVQATAVGSPTWVAHWMTLRTGLTDDYAFTPNARIGVSGIKLDALLVNKQDSAWSFIQNTTQHVMGASGITEDGSFRFWGKDTLRSGVPTEIIGVDGFADLGWVLSSDDKSDRVEVSFTPPMISGSGHHTVWDATDVIRVNAGQTRTISFSLDGMAARAYHDFQMATTDPMGSTASRWIAFTTATGSSPVVDSTALRIEVESLTWNTGRIRITNTTANTLWIRDVNGNPALTLRARYVAQFGDPEIVAVGASQETALTPFTHDGGTIIQRQEDAALLADWLFANLSAPQPVINSVNVLPNYTRRVGDIVTVYDPIATKIRAHCLIAGVHNTPTTQSLDLALLAVTNDTALRYAETIAPSATTIGRLFDAVDSYATGAATIGDLINFWEKESVVIA